jgi:hypothetical protein
VGNDESVKPVVSGHFWATPVTAAVLVGAATATKRHKPAKSELREFRESFICYLLEDCSGWIENLKVPPR